MYTASFFGDEEQYPRYSVGDVYPTQQAALLACEADLRRQAMAGRKYYNDLCYYDITEELEDGERHPEGTRTVNAAELPDLNLPNVGDWVRVWVRNKVRHGEIVVVDPREHQGLFAVAEFTKSGNVSQDRRRWHYFTLKGLDKVIVYRRFTPLTPTENGPTWERVVVPVK